MAAQTDSVVKDVPQQVDLDFGMAIERMDGWIDSIVRLLPNIIVAVVVLGLFYGLGVIARRVIQSRAARRERDNLGEVLGGFVKWIVDPDRVSHCRHHRDSDAEAR